MLNVKFNGTEYEIDDSLVATSKTMIINTLQSLSPLPEPQQITVNWLGTEPSYGNSFYISYNDQAYYYGDTFTVMTGNDLYFSGTQGSVSWNVVANGILLGEDEWSSFTGPWTIPLNATSITVNSIEYSGNGTLWTVDITYTTN